MTTKLNGWLSPLLTTIVLIASGILAFGMMKGTLESLASTDSRQDISVTQNTSIAMQNKQDIAVQRVMLEKIQYDVTEIKSILLNRQ